MQISVTNCKGWHNQNEFYTQQQIHKIQLQLQLGYALR